MPNKLHTISGHNFHGFYSVTLRGPSEGFRLSPSQQRRALAATWLCKGTECKCYGGYGDGLDSDSADLRDHLNRDGSTYYTLVPAGPDRDDS